MQFMEALGYVAWQRHPKLGVCFWNLLDLATSLFSPDHGSLRAGLRLIPANLTKHFRTHHVLQYIHGLDMLGPAFGIPSFVPCTKEGYFVGSKTPLPITGVTRPQSGEESSSSLSQLKVRPTYQDFKRILPDSVSMPKLNVQKPSEAQWHDASNSIISCMACSTVLGHSISRYQSIS